MSNNDECFQSESESPTLIVPRKRGRPPISKCMPSLTGVIGNQIPLGATPAPKDEILSGESKFYPIFKSPSAPDNASKIQNEVKEISESVYPEFEKIPTKSDVSVAYEVDEKSYCEHVDDKISINVLEYGVNEATQNLNTTSNDYNIIQPESDDDVEKVNSGDDNFKQIPKTPKNVKLKQLKCKKNVMLEILNNVSGTDCSIENNCSISEQSDLKQKNAMFNKTTDTTKMCEPISSKSDEDASLEEQNIISSSEAVSEENLSPVELSGLIKLQSSTKYMSDNKLTSLCNNNEVNELDPNVIECLPEVDVKINEQTIQQSIDSTPKKRGRPKKNYTLSSSDKNELRQSSTFHNMSEDKEKLSEEPKFFPIFKSPNASKKGNVFEHQDKNVDPIVSSNISEKTIEDDINSVNEVCGSNNNSNTAMAEKVDEKAIKHNYEPNTVALVNKKVTESIIKNHDKKHSKLKKNSSRLKKHVNKIECAIKLKDEISEQSLLGDQQIESKTEFSDDIANNSILLAENSQDMSLIMKNTIDTIENTLCSYKDMVSNPNSKQTKHKLKRKTETYNEVSESEINNLGLEDNKFNEDINKDKVLQLENVDNLWAPLKRGRSHKSKKDCHIENELSKKGTCELLNENSINKNKLPQSNEVADKLVIPQRRNRSCKSKNSLMLKDKDVIVIQDSKECIIDKLNEDTMNKNGYPQSDDVNDLVVPQKKGRQCKSKMSLQVKDDNFHETEKVIVDILKADTVNEKEFSQSDDVVDKLVVPRKRRSRKSKLEDSIIVKSEDGKEVSVEVLNEDVSDKIGILQSDDVVDELVVPQKRGRPHKLLVSRKRGRPCKLVVPQERGRPHKLVVVWKRGKPHKSKCSLSSEEIVETEDAEEIVEVLDEDISDKNNCRPPDVVVNELVVPKKRGRQCKLVIPQKIGGQHKSECSLPIEDNKIVEIVDAPEVLIVDKLDRNDFPESDVVVDELGISQKRGRPRKLVSQKTGRHYISKCPLLSTEDDLNQNSTCKNPGEKSVDKNKEMKLFPIFNKTESPKAGLKLFPIFNSPNAVYQKKNLNHAVKTKEKNKSMKTNKQQMGDDIEDESNNKNEQTEDESNNKDEHIKDESNNKDEHKSFKRNLKKKTKRKKILFVSDESEIDNEVKDVTDNKFESNRSKAVKCTELSENTTSAALTDIKDLETVQDVDLIVDQVIVDSNVSSGNTVVNQEKQKVISNHTTSDKKSKSRRKNINCIVESEINPIILETEVVPNVPRRSLRNKGAENNCIKNSEVVSLKKSSIKSKRKKSELSKDSELIDIDCIVLDEKNNDISSDVVCIDSSKQSENVKENSKFFPIFTSKKTLTEQDDKSNISKKRKTCDAENKVDDTIKSSSDILLPNKKKAKKQSTLEEDVIICDDIKPNNSKKSSKIFLNSSKDVAKEKVTNIKKSKIENEDEKSNFALSNDNIIKNKNEANEKINVCGKTVKKLNKSEFESLCFPKFSHINRYSEPICDMKSNFVIYPDDTDFTVNKPVWNEVDHLIDADCLKVLKSQECKTYVRQKFDDELSKDDDGKNGESNVLWTECIKNNIVETKENKFAVREIKSWLLQWKDKFRKNSEAKPYHSDSSSSYSGSDSDDDGISNSIIIYGAPGSGKTSLVFSLANELGFTVLEVNASSSRSGRNISNQLKEALESYHVESIKIDKEFLNPDLEIKDKRKSRSSDAKESKNEAKSIKSFFGGKNKKNQKQKLEEKKNITSFFKTNNPENNTKKGRKKTKNRSKNISNNNAETSHSVSDKSSCRISSLTIILFDDVDIVFEEDEGFWSTVKGFLKISKKPVIFTVSRNLNIVKNILNSDIQVFNMKPASKDSAIDTLKTFCKMHSREESATNLKLLTSQNLCDVRRNILNAQFWTKLSKCHQNELDLDKSSTDVVNINSFLVGDQNFSVGHFKNLLFNQDPFHLINAISDYQDLGYDILHSNLFLLSSLLKSLQYNEVWDIVSNEKSGEKNKSYSDSDMWKEACEIFERKKKILKCGSSSKDLDLISGLIEEFSFADVLKRPLINNFQCVSVSERIKKWTSGLPICHDHIEHNENILNIVSLIHIYTLRKFHNEKASNCVIRDDCDLILEHPFTTFDQTIPNNKIEENLAYVSSALPNSQFLNKTALTLDYLSMIKIICDEEKNRQINSGKRSGRFLHYFDSISFLIDKKTF